MKFLRFYKYLTDDSRSLTIQGFLYFVSKGKPKTGGSRELDQPLCVCLLDCLVPFYYRRRRHIRFAVSLN